MVKVTASEAFEILNKNDKANILQNFGKVGLGNIKHYFVNYVAEDMVDVNDESVKETYNIAIENGAPRKL